MDSSNLTNVKSAVDSMSDLDYMIQESSCMAHLDSQHMHCYFQKHKAVAVVADAVAASLVHLSISVQV